MINGQVTYSVHVLVSKWKVYMYTCMYSEHGAESVSIISTSLHVSRTNVRALINRLTEGLLFNAVGGGREKRCTLAFCTEITVDIHART